MKHFLIKLLTKIFTHQAKQIIKRHKPLVVAIVGSVGKTSTKHAIASVLNQKYRVQYQDGNYNVPLSLSFVVTGQELPAIYNPFGWLKAWLKGQQYILGNYNYDVVILELGTDTPGDVMQFSSIITPDIAVITAISEEHMEHFKTIEKVAEEELSIAKFSKELLINIDDTDKDLTNLYLPADSDVQYYGFNAIHGYKISAKRNNHHSFNVHVSLKNGQNVEAEVNIASRQGLKSLAGASAVGEQLGLSTKQIQKGLTSLKPTSGRMRLFDGVNNSVLIDDTYNSSPLACEAAINTLNEITAPQKIAILGSMNELGALSKEAHLKIGKLCQPNHIDLVITIGDQANKYLAMSAEEQGCKVIRTTNPIKAGKVAYQNIQPHSLVLVKGSQNGVFAEEAVKQLLNNPSDFNNLVCKSDFWMNKKAEFLNNLH